MKINSVSKEEWLKARQAFLQKEKEFTHAREKLNRERTELPWLEIEKQYVFESENGPVQFTDLFGGRSQLIVYHFMFAPEWTQGCMGCSFLADHYNPAVVHLNQFDISMVTVSRAPIEQIKTFRGRMGWTFPWVSSFANDFNRDFKVAFTEAETKSGLNLYNQNSQPGDMSDLPGTSVFYRDDKGTVYLTYSTFARGLDIFLTTYHLIDITPKGRGEGENMSWIRHHDRYQAATFVPPWVEVPGNSVRE